MIEADVRVGLDIACLGALRDDLSPGAWLDAIDDETVWNALASMPAQGNPIALLAVLDAALYRAGDERFRRLADDTIAILLDDHLGLPPNCDVYGLFEVLTDFVMDRLGLVEGAGRCPGFWRRMCAWMQAGLIVRTAVACRALPDVGRLEEWCKGHMLPAGSLRRLADCRAEPVVIGHMRVPGSLRHEVLARLGCLKERHEKAGRVVPKAVEIESARSRMGGDSSGLASVVPGPAAMHLRPSEHRLPRVLLTALPKLGLSRARRWRSPARRTCRSSSFCATANWQTCGRAAGIDRGRGGGTTISATWLISCTLRASSPLLRGTRRWST